MRTEPQQLLQEPHYQGADHGTPWTRNTADNEKDEKQWLGAEGKIGRLDQAIVVRQERAAEPAETSQCATDAEPGRPCPFDRNS